MECLPILLLYLFLLNMCLHMFSLKYDLKSSYKYENEFKELGIEFFKGTQIGTWV